MKFFIKEALILVYLVIASGIYLKRFFFLQEERGLIYILVFASLFLGLVITLLLAANIKNNVVRSILALIFFISAVFIDVYYKSMNVFPTYNLFVSLMDARGFVEEATLQYADELISSIATGGILLLGLILRPIRKLKLPNFIYTLAPILSIFLLTVLGFFRGGNGLDGFPTMFVLPSYLNLYAYESFQNIRGERSDVSFKRNGEDVPYDIVLIVDESVSANYLDLNSVNGVPTGLNDKHEKIDIYNYGYAASIATCSGDVNLTLRYGGTRKGYHKINSLMPSIWAYAKKSDLRTVLVDGQRTGGNLQNYMNWAEKSEIDDFIQFDDVEIVDRDMAVADQLIKLLGNDTAEFIFVNKMGAHFPVNDKYPENLMKYKPVLNRGSFVNIGDTGDKDGFDGTVKGWKRYRNSYRNTLLWNVNGFFSKLFKQADFKNSVLLYISDHGQDLHERHSPGKNTHCGNGLEINMQEGLVPLVILKDKKLEVLNFKRYLADNKNKSSLYNIFPTLLHLMKYDPQEIESVYGRALHQKTNDPFTFNVNFGARLGSQPEWLKIDVDKIAEPPTSDY
jgi:glucan phosphoethanolaminetransferase (alkaline phosphatase superfamily)